MFLGRYQHTVDGKGRVSIPRKFRDVLTDRYEERLIVTTDFDPCLVAYPLEEWRQIEEKAKTLPVMQREVKEWLRFFYSAAVECEVDRQGRILLSPSHREYAHLSKEVVVLGMFNKIEIWDSKRWKERESQMPKNFEKIGATLAGLGF
ncbi:MAG TPA: division/cell wall cluster transcriptional repressor MraZ [Nitrospiria bacterium]